MFTPNWQLDILRNAKSQTAKQVVKYLRGSLGRYQILARYILITNISPTVRVCRTGEGGSRVKSLTEMWESSQTPKIQGAAGIASYRAESQSFPLPTISKYTIKYIST